MSSPKIVGADKLLDLPDINKFVGQQEDLLGPLIAIGNDGSLTLLTFRHGHRSAASARGHSDHSRWLARISHRLQRQDLYQRNVERRGRNEAELSEDQRAIVVPPSFHRREDHRRVFGGPSTPCSAVPGATRKDHVILT
jgi:hypothetical protein